MLHSDPSIRGWVDASSGGPVLVAVVGGGGWMRTSAVISYYYDWDSVGHLAWLASIELRQAKVLVGYSCYCGGTMHGV